MDSMDSTEAPDPSQPMARVLFPMLVAIVSASLRERTLPRKVIGVLRGVRSLGLEVVTLSLEQQDQPFRARAVKVCCPRCGGVAEKLKGLKKRQRFILLGKLNYRRCRYKCISLLPKCGDPFSPLDDQLGLLPLHRGHSREFVSELVLLCTILPFDKGCSLFRRAYGFPVSHPLAWKLAFGIGDSLTRDELARAKRLWDERVTDPEKFDPNPHALRLKKRVKRVYVMTDNSKMPIQSGKRGRNAKKKAISAPAESWRDARALLIFNESDMAKNPSGKRSYILRRRVLGHIGSLEEWHRLVFMTLYDEGVFWANEVVIINDGGAGIWEMFTELLPATESRKVVQILDWYHATEHLWRVGKLLRGITKEGKPTQACFKWVHGLLAYLEHGEVGNVLQRLRKIKRGSVAALDELRKLIDYFDDHRERMSYAAYRKAGMLIGSGAVESVHNWVIQARCKLPGMQWSVAGANAILRLRCAWASDRWDDIFGPEPDSRTTSRAPLRAAA